MCEQWDTDYSPLFYSLSYQNVALTAPSIFPKQFVVLPILNNSLDTINLTVTITDSRESAMLVNLPVTLDSRYQVVIPENEEEYVISLMEALVSSMSVGNYPIAIQQLMSIVSILNGPMATGT
jgi:hypothetical protein